MLCEACGSCEASIHLTQVLEGEVREAHLCPTCAQERGLNVQGALSIPDLLFEMAGQKDVEQAAQRSCPQCHMRGTDFKKGSRLGCAACYQAFRAELAEILPAMHKGIRHTGKRPMNRAPGETANVAELERRLAEAIAAEQFEEAARLRDRIRAVQGGGRGGAR